MLAWVTVWEEALIVGEVLLLPLVSPDLVCCTNFARHLQGSIPTMIAACAFCQFAPPCSMKNVGTWFQAEMTSTQQP